MSLPPPALALPAALLAERVRVAEQDGAVVHGLRAGGRPRSTPRDLAAYAGLVAEALDRPLFRLLPRDLARPPEQRAAALLALVDAAEVAGAVVLVDAADGLVPDPAHAAAVRLRLGEWDRGVVLLATGAAGDVAPLAHALRGVVTVHDVA